MGTGRVQEGSDQSRLLCSLLQGAGFYPSPIWRMGEALPPPQSRDPAGLGSAVPYGLRGTCPCAQGGAGAGAVGPRPLCPPTSHRRHHTPGTPVTPSSWPPGTGSAHPHGHPLGAALLWHRVSCIPTPARPWVCPSNRSFIVSQRGPGHPPLSHPGSWEPPESTLPLPAAPPGRRQRPGSRLRALRGRVTGMPGCAAQAPRAGNLVQRCQTGSDERAAPAAKSGTSFPPHCGRKLLPKKSRPGVWLACGVSRPGPPALAAQRRGGEMPPIATRGISPPPPRLRFHNVSSDLSTSCHQMSRPAPTRSISPQGDRVSPERHRHSRLQWVCRPRRVTPWPAEGGSGVAPTF